MKSILTIAKNNSVTLKVIYRLGDKIKHKIKDSWTAHKQNKRKRGSHSPITVLLLGKSLTYLSATAYNLHTGPTT